MEFFSGIHFSDQVTNQYPFNKALQLFLPRFVI